MAAAGSGGGGCCALASKAMDAVLLLYYGLMVVIVPLVDSQVCLEGLVEHPKALVDLKAWYATEFGDYLLAERPHFFRGLVWVEVLLLWPLSFVCTYAFISGRRAWFCTASLVAGVTGATAMAAIMGELLGSGRASEKLLMTYAAFVALSFLAILRGVLPCSSCKMTPLPSGVSEGGRHVSRKKKA